MRTLSNESGVRRLPLAIEKGLAAARLAKSRLTDGFVQDVGVENVTCHKRCTHCCHYPVTISLWEGISLYRALQREGLWRATLKASLERHAGLTFGTAPEIWLMSEIPCPLLADGLCIIYSNRPFRCRATLSTQDPDLCRPAYFGPATFADSSQVTSEFEAVEQRSARASRDDARGLDAHVPLSVAVLVAHQLIEGIIELDEIALTFLRILSRSP